MALRCLVIRGLVKEAEEEINKFLSTHEVRVLHMAQSPDGTTVCTAAADETLRFWKCLSGGEQNKKEKQAHKESVLSSAMTIR